MEMGGIKYGDKIEKLKDDNEYVLDNNGDKFQDEILIVIR